jgi:hypothetical protein
MTSNGRFIELGQTPMACMLNSFKRPTILHIMDYHAISTRERSKLMNDRTALVKDNNEIESKQ